MSMNMVDLAAIALVAMLGSGIVLVFLSSAMSRDGRSYSVQVPSMQSGPVFLFQDGVLIDATKDALDLIRYRTGHLTDFDAMFDALGTQFPKLSTAISDPSLGLDRLFCEDDPSFWIDLEYTADTVRVALNGQTENAGHSLAKLLVESDRDLEVSLMRDVSQYTPQLIWQEDQSGTFLWANHAYLKLSRQLGLEPGQSLFPELDRTISNDDPSQQRVATKSSDQDGHWFDVHTVKRAQGLIHFATDANAIMRADKDRHNFVQTLGKTFAQLSIGLAIFDKDRQLAMFNPALLDMTNLPFDFLSARPRIDTVLDRLREMRIMPEPKDYSSWRDRFTAVEKAAKNGTYSENWALPDGQTFRVTGRPHPDGAFAFLFEDVSAEVSLTRRFRSDIETGQAVLDTLPDAIAVFSSAGTLVMSNRAYARLWETKHELSLEHRELQAELDIWQERCIPSPMWEKMRSFLQQLGARKAWSDDAMMDDGRHLRCHACAITGAMTMVRFAIAPPIRPVVRRLSAAQNMIQAGKG